MLWFQHLSAACLHILSFEETKTWRIFSKCLKPTTDVVTGLERILLTDASKAQTFMGPHPRRGVYGLAKVGMSMRVESVTVEEATAIGTMNPELSAPLRAQHAKQYQTFPPTLKTQLFMHTVADGKMCSVLKGEGKKTDKSNGTKLKTQNVRSLKKYHVYLASESPREENFHLHDTDLLWGKLPLQDALW